MPPVVRQKLQVGVTLVAERAVAECMHRSTGRPRQRARVRRASVVNPPAVVDTHLLAAVGPPLAIRVQYRVRRPYGVQFVLPDAAVPSRPPRAFAARRRHSASDASPCCVQTASPTQRSGALADGGRAQSCARRTGACVRVRQSRDASFSRSPQAEHRAGDNRGRRDDRCRDRRR
jgi:hypothetical protein